MSCVSLHWKPWKARLETELCFLSNPLESNAVNFILWGWWKLQKWVRIELGFCCCCCCLLLLCFVFLSESSPWTVANTGGLREVGNLHTDVVGENKECLQPLEESQEVWNGAVRSFYCLRDLSDNLVRGFHHIFKENVWMSCLGWEVRPQGTCSN